MLFIPGIPEAPVPGLSKAHSILLQPAFFDLTFESLIVDEVSLNAKQEERPEWHFCKKKGVPIARNALDGTCVTLSFI
jgi:hypothetical protein